MYDSLPQNSQLIVLDQALNCLDIMNILNQNKTQEIILWNQHLQTEESIFTLNSAIKLVIHYFNYAIYKSQHSDRKNSQKMDEEFTS